MTTPPTTAPETGSGTPASGLGVMDVSTMRLDHAALEVLGQMVDNIVVMAGVQAAMDAYQAVQIDQARREAELSVQIENSDGMNPWSQAKTAWRTIVSEIACALHIPEVTAQKLISESKTLVNELPATLEGLRLGRFSRRHAQVIIDGSWRLPVELREQFEATVLPYAETLTVSRFTAKARKVRERLDKTTMTERHAKAREDRHVEFLPDEDGMAWLNLFLDASVAQAAFRKATDIAKALQGPDESRTLAQLQADVLAETMLSSEPPCGAAADNAGSGFGTGTGSGAGTGTPGHPTPAGNADSADGEEPPPDDYDPFDSDDPARDFDREDAPADSGEDATAAATPESAPATVFGDAHRPESRPNTDSSIAPARPNVALMVPALSLLGQSDEPAILDGYGPIDLDTAKRLVGNAKSFTRILTHPETGTILSVGRKKYRVPTVMTTSGASPSDTPDTNLARTITGNPFAHIRPDVALIVPALSLLGRSGEPKILEGASPIDVDTAQRLVGNMTAFIRILTHPETGTDISAGRKRYRVSKAMRRWLAFRDQTCTKPGCGAPAAYCDLDHIVEWQHGGESSVQNLAYLCPKHHAEKHHTGWRTEMTDTGTLWTSPTGKKYLSPHGMDIQTG
jgi:hypothetical protein